MQEKSAKTIIYRRFDCGKYGSQEALEVLSGVES